MQWTGVRQALEAEGLAERPNTFLAAMNWRDTAKFAETMRRPVVARDLHTPQPRRYGLR